ncbi:MULTISPECIES: fasciclin [unclassified Porphyromonas]|uniref:fasciclin n=1 Tax=unclassified Porphyromonas TaxID=2645799 RepID=UPI00052CBAB6|nr:MULTISPECIES: fasciclin [unclassified Porphyromonas]KGN84363.1 fasciclin [Porphyromonas sp. COT-290 OH860]KGO01202.1 fasciclin [Porphyromonas sp. COT-290 OH3588]
MKKFIYALWAVLLVGTSSCTKYNLIDTGDVNGNHDTTLWGYLQTDSYNWDSLSLMIKHAEMVEVFEGKGEYGKDMTFFGFTNHSIRSYMLANGYKRVTDIPKEDCAYFLKISIIPGRHKLADIPNGRRSTDPDQIIGTGGKEYKTMEGRKLWIFTFREPYGDIPNAGPYSIYVASSAAKKITRIASTDITTNTGIVHSLPYHYRINDL